MMQLRPSLDTPAAPERLTLRGLGAFTALAALLAILADAAIGHGLLWENDPYWTYWVTKTFLIATVFGLGTAWLGVGAGRGAVLTAIHTLILTIYYWSLAPVGLPSHPDWLDLEHTWVTGVPVHFGVIYLGYLLALWLWRRRLFAGTPVDEVGRLALAALITGVGIVVVGGGLEALALWEFPGVTWFIVRLLVVVPFIVLWWAAAGRRPLAGVVGGITLAMVLISYSHFLGPTGLPDWPPRIFERAAPGATVEWLSYRAEFLVAFPITLVVAVAAFVLSATRPVTLRAPRRLLGALVVTVLAVIAVGAWAAVATEPDDERVTLRADGSARIEQGRFYSDNFSAGSATVRLRARDVNPRVTPLRPHDEVRLDATIEHPDGSTFVVRSRRPMVDDPLGRFTTWWGVGIDVWHHGRSGIGSDRVPATFSEIAVFGVGNVATGQQQVAGGVPVHVMTTQDGAAELDVGDPAFAVPGLPDGHLRVAWNAYESDHSETPKLARYALGLIVLLALLGGMAALLRLQTTEGPE